MENLSIHHFADQFPLLAGTELQELADDIKANGQQELITLTPDGKTVVDGRNRLRAALMVGIEPKFQRMPKDSDEIDILKLIISKNIHRRNLSVGQRAMLAQSLLAEIEKVTKAKRNANLKKGREYPQVKPDSPDPGERENRTKPGVGKATHMAGELVGVNNQAISMAKTVSTYAPGMAEQVRKGELALTTAFEKVQEARGRRDKKTEILEDSAPRLMDYLPPHGTMPTRKDRFSWVVQARIAWIDYMAKDAATSFQISEALGISDGRVRELAKQHNIEIPADRFALRKKKGNFDINRTAEVLADELNALDLSIDRVRDNIADLDMSRIGPWITSYRSAARKLRNLSDVLAAMQKELNANSTEEKEE